MVPFAQIKLFVMDVDGVLTDGHVIYSDRGVELKTFHTQDGMGLKLLKQAGVELGIITARSSEIVTRRAKELGIDHLYQGQHNKLVALTELKDRLGLCFEQIAYIGDDLPDLSCIQQAGLGIAVQNAVGFVKAHADYCTVQSGGSGAVREACELILEKTDKLSELNARYSLDHQ